MDPLRLENITLYHWRAANYRDIFYFPYNYCPLLEMVITESGGQWFHSIIPRTLCQILLPLWLHLQYVPDSIDLWDCKFIGQ